MKIMKGDVISFKRYGEIEKIGEVIRKISPSQDRTIRFTQYIVKCDDQILHIEKNEIMKKFKA